MIRVRHLVVQPFFCPFAISISLITVANVTLFDELTTLFDCLFYRNRSFRKNLNKHMNEVRERILLIFSSFATNINKLSDGDTALRNRLTRQINNDAAITIDTISVILTAFPEVSAEWLLRGKGQMILSENLPPILGDESENDLDTHAMLAQARKEIDTLHIELASLKEKNLKQAGCIEWQKDFISELISEKTELEKKIPNEVKKDIV